MNSLPLPQIHPNTQEIFAANTFTKSFRPLLGFGLGSSNFPLECLVCFRFERLCTCGPVNMACCLGSKRDKVQTSTILDIEAIVQDYVWTKFKEAR